MSLCVKCCAMYVLLCVRAFCIAGMGGCVQVLLKMLCAAVFISCVSFDMNVSWFLMVSFDVSSFRL